MPTGVYVRTEENKRNLSIARRKRPSGVLGKHYSNKGRTYEEYFSPERAEQEKRKRGKGKTYEEMYGPEKATKLRQLRAEHFCLQREQFGAMTKERWANDEAYRRMMIEIAHHKARPSKETQAILNKLSSERLNKRWEDPEYRKLSSERFYKLWKDPDFVLKQIKSRGVRPNKLEKYFDGILDSHSPEYKYNGDGRLGIVLAGLVPDFVNVNGKKQVIEVFGDYWHGLKKPKWHQTELGRIMAYNSVGWKCLVIWEHELKKLTEEEIVEKISDFQRGGKRCPV